MPVHIFTPFALGALHALGGADLIFVALLTHRHDCLSCHGDGCRVAWVRVHRRVLRRSVNLDEDEHPKVELAPQMDMPYQFAARPSGLLPSSARAQPR